MGLSTAVLASCVMLLALATSASATTGTGKISGKVTSACACESFRPLANIEVNVYEGNTSKTPFPVGHATTNASGEYTVEGLPGASYKVEFSPEHGKGNYVTQFYKGKPSLASAELVTVLEGHTTEKIDAELQVGAKIAGVVTEAGSGVSLQGIEVYAYEQSNDHPLAGYATTNAHGEYTIEGLTDSTYNLEFTALESGLNFVTQYYDDKSSLATADPVEVTEGKTTEDINAQMQVGGEIEGTVTGAYTHAPVSNVEVVAYGPGGVRETEAFTGTNGHYVITGLPTGSYSVEFVSSNYITQYFNDKTSLAGANSISVIQGSSTSGINAALVPSAPTNTATPTITGTPAAGQALTCSNGSWTGEPSLKFTYQWLHNGSAISGANGSIYGVQTSDQGASLTCKVTASNKYGTASVTSAAVFVVFLKPPPPHRLTPRVTLLSQKISVRAGAARVPISCANATCEGTIELTERTIVRHRRHGRTIVRIKTIFLGQASYVIATGARSQVTVLLTAAGRRALARAGNHRLLATLRITVADGKTVRAQVLLVRTPVRHKRRHR
jgi:hypothetical protein